MNIIELINKKIIKREGKEFILDLEELSQLDLDLHKKFILNPYELFLDLKKQLNETYSINNLRLVNFNFIENVSKIGKDNLGEMVKIRGLVSKTTKKLSLVKSKTYQCPSCGSVIKSNNPIKKCSCGRRGEFDEISIELEDFREIELEELQEDIKGRQPVKIRIRLTEELTDEEFERFIQPGSKVIILGVVQKIKLNSRFSDEEVYDFRIFALNIESAEEGFDDKMSEEDLEQINNISIDNPIETLSNSLAPNIFGNTELKKILLLQMVGGVKKTLSDGKLTRDRIHVLVVGEAATSKTELAKNVNIRCPKSYYVCADNLTSAGLTASVEKDELTGSWGFHVGPLCKANGSICIIDELDKTNPKNLSALYTPLESGIVALAKAGIDTKIPAESSILALANPKHGVFDSGKSLVEQINLPPPLLSRFDLVYILKDDINKQRDDQIVDIICSQDKSTTQIIPVNLFRKYIGYAKKLKPEYNESELVAELKDFYHDTRKKSISRDSNMKGMQIGARHLQGIIRLAGASAKIHLREKVEIEDIRFAKKLFYDSLIQIGLDDSGIIDLGRLGQGKTISQRKLGELIMDKIRQLYSENKEISNNELKSIMIESGMKESEYYKTIEELNRSGEIIKLGNNWKLY